MIATGINIASRVIKSKAIKSKKLKIPNLIAIDLSYKWSLRMRKVVNLPSPRRSSKFKVRLERENLGLRTRIK